MYSVTVGAFVEDYGWLDKTQAIPRIISFARRCEGWRFGKGKKPSLEIIARALRIANLFIRLGSPKTGAFLGEDGSIAVVGYIQPERSLEASCYPDGTFELSIEEAGREIPETNFCAASEIEAAIIKQVCAWGLTTNSREFSISTTMTRSLGGSVVWATQKTEYPFPALPAPSFITAQSAIISDAQKLKLPANPRSFGSLSDRSYQQEQRLSIA